MSKRIVSFLPSATEIMYELGAKDQVFAVTHECDYPQDAKTKPKVIHSSFDPKEMSSHEIDKKIIGFMRSGKDIYILDDNVLKKANPDLIVVQGICEVCSPFTREINKAITFLGRRPEVLILNPRDLDDILKNIIEIGKKVDKIKKSKELVSLLEIRIKNIKTIPKISRPKVLCIEWIDPIYSAGHWIPQMVEITGGINGISSIGEKSRIIEIDEIVKFDPDIIVLMPCGFDVKRTILECERLYQSQKWRSLRAIKEGKVYAVNANEYFSKPGPRTIIGLEILAKIVNPETFETLQIPKNSFQKIDLN